MTSRTGVAAKSYQKVNGHISPYDPSLSPELKERRNMETASRQLLCALWQEHPEIMRHRGAVKPWA